MKTKLTLTVDEELVPKAKAFARSRGISLSRLVEESLRDELRVVRDVPFSRRWRGRFETASHDDERFHALAKKYL